MIETWREEREEAEPWSKYSLTEEDWLLLYATGWQVAVDRAKFIANPQHQVSWSDGWEGDHLAYNWTCSCGGATGHNFPTEQSVIKAAEKHLDQV